jgi:RNA polymerase sigma-70 factor (ECF subfamily)
MEAMGPRQSSDERLIERARHGDQAAQQELWRAHRRWVAAIILAHRPRSVELEDLLQDVAVRFISRLHTLREDAAFRHWLRQVAVNVCRGACRQRRWTLRIWPGGPQRAGEGASGEIAEPPSTEPGSAAQVERREVAAVLLAQALTLPMAYREPLLLRCVQSMSYQQIADILGLPLTTVETRLARARRMLREEVADEKDRAERAAPTAARASAGGF